MQQLPSQVVITHVCARECAHVFSRRGLLV